MDCKTYTLTFERHHSTPYAASGRVIVRQDGVDYRYDYSVTGLNVTMGCEEQTPISYNDEQVIKQAIFNKSIGL